jgi:hypothetical protein
MVNTYRSEGENSSNTSRENEANSICAIDSGMAGIFGAEWYHGGNNDMHIDNMRPVRRRRGR